MKTSQYKKGVLEILSRAREIDPQIGNYVEHQQSGVDHFNVMLSNGTLKLPRQVAHSQQEFPPHVPKEWIMEIAGTFEKGTGEPGKQTAGLLGKLLQPFKFGK